MTITTDRAAAAAWAREILANPATVILDTETTGLDDDAEICQIAVIDVTGAVLLDTLVRPTHAIPAGAKAIHGISDEMVAEAPPFPYVLGQLHAVLAGRMVVIYNAAYDTRLLRQSAKAHQLTTDYLPLLGAAGYTCAMEWYAQWFGEWTGRGYRWQRLRGGNHTALGDCRATLALIRRMAEEGSHAQH